MVTAVRMMWIGREGRSGKGLLLRARLEQRRGSSMARKRYLPARVSRHLPSRTE